MCTSSASMQRFNKRIVSFIKGNVHSLCIDAKVQQKNTLIYKRKCALPLHHCKGSTKEYSHL